MIRLPVLIAVGVVSFFLFLLATAPAPVLLGYARPSTGSPVGIYQVDGTISSGRAAVLDLAGLRLADVEWQLRPLSLLLLRVSHHVRGRSDAGPVDAIVGRSLFGSIRVAQIKGSLPLAQVVRAARLPPLPISGRLDMNLSSLRVADNRLRSAKGSLEIDGLQWELASPSLPFGSYHLELKTESDRILVEIENTTGPVDLSGSGELTGAGTYAVDLRLRPQASAPAGVVGLIQQTGKPDAEGWYRLRREDTL